MVDQILGKKLESGKNREVIPLMIVNKTKNDMKNTEKGQDGQRNQ